MRSKVPEANQGGGRIASHWKSSSPFISLKMEHAPTNHLILPPRSNNGPAGLHVYITNSVTATTPDQYIGSSTKISAFRFHTPFTKNALHRIVINEIVSIITTTRGLMHLTLFGLGIMRSFSWPVVAIRVGHGLCLCDTLKTTHSNTRRFHKGVLTRFGDRGRKNEGTTVLGTKQVAQKSASRLLHTEANLEDK